VSRFSSDTTGPAPGSRRKPTRVDQRAHQQQPAAVFGLGRRRAVSRQPATDPAGLDLDDLQQAAVVAEVQADLVLRRRRGG
jgi:hypothetical protein